jgi:ribosomal protein S18 acetylase RimI-like enzyme
MTDTKISVRMMASTPTFTIVTIPKQFNDGTLPKRYVDKYRELRLRSLKSDPDSFSSTFADESKQPFEFWTGRLMTPRARHFLAVQFNKDSSDASVTAGVQAILETEWVGTLVLLGPNAVTGVDESPGKTLAPSRFVEDLADMNGDSASIAYHLAGFYVTPEARSQGLGSSLVDAAMEAIVNDSQKMHNAGAICTVGASHKNLVVRRLFKRMGFSEVAEEVCNTTDGRCLTEIVLRRDFVR